MLVTPSEGTGVADAMIKALCHTRKMLTRDACGGYDDIPLCMRWLVPVSGERTMSACVEVVSLPPWRHALEVQRFDPIGRTGCRVYGDHIQLNATLNDDEA